MALEFDPDKSFDENIAEFEQYLERLDPEFARIFLDTKEKLLGDGMAVQGSRTAFNNAVIEKLKALVPKGKGT